MSKIHFIAYADNNFFTEKAKIVFENTKHIFDTHTLYNRDDIDSDFLSENSEILNQERGGGYWLWKSYFILKKLNEVDEKDIVFYQDAGDLIYNDISGILRETINKNDGFFLVLNNHNHKKYTKRDCFKIMNCDTFEYHNLRQLEAGCCAFRKEEKNVNFVKEWLYWSKKPEVITDVNENENYAVFKDHRHDQSILTNLAHKYKIKTISIMEIIRYVKFNA